MQIGIRRYESKVDNQDKKKGRKPLYLLVSSEWDDEEETISPPEYDFGSFNE